MVSATTEAEQVRTRDTADATDIDIETLEGRLEQLEESLPRGGFEGRLAAVERRLAGFVLRKGGQRHGGPPTGPVEAAPRGSH